VLHFAWRRADPQRLEAVATAATDPTVGWVAPPPPLPNMTQADWDVPLASRSHIARARLTPAMHRPQPLRLRALLEPTVSRVVGFLDTRFSREKRTPPVAEWDVQAVSQPTTSASAAAVLAAWPVLSQRLLLAGHLGMEISLVGAAVLLHLQSLPVLDDGFLSLTASGTHEQLPLLLSKMAAAVRAGASVLYMSDAEM